MAALLIKLCGNSTLKYLKHTTRCNKAGFGKINFCLTVKNFQMKCKDEPPFRTRLALPPDYDNVVEFMCEAYYKHEPAVINIGLEGTDAPRIWRTMMQEQVKGGYSIIAETPDNCLIGAALNQITDTNEAQRLYDLAKCCCKEGPVCQILEFFGYMSEMAAPCDRYCVSTIFDQASLAVDSNYQRMGIAKRLIVESWILARDCGFQLFKLQCDNTYCANIARGFGWPVIWSIPFGQYVKNGDIVFKCVKEPHTVSRVFADQLRNCKTYCPPYKQCKTKTPPSV